MPVREEMGEYGEFVGLERGGRVAGEALSLTYTLRGTWKLPFQGPRGLCLCTNASL